MGRLTVRQRRCLARMDRALAGDAVLTKLVALFPDAPRERAKPRTARWCAALVLLGLIAMVLGIAGAEALGVGAAVAVSCGATAIAAGLAFMLASATSDGRAWPTPR